MSRRIPYGERESARLEFKRSEALDEPGKIAREVVAMLNAEGGEIWVGVEERDGRLAAVQGVGDAEVARRSLRDRMVDTIEPSPSPREVEVEVVPVPEDPKEREVLHLDVRPNGERKPYALVERTRRLYVTRIEDRLRPLTREEIADFFRKGQPTSVEGDPETEARRKAMDKVLRERRSLQRKEGLEAYWVRIQPIENLELEIQDPVFEEYLTDAIRSGNRAVGWTFADPHTPPHLSNGKRVSGRDQDNRAEIRRDGGISLTVPLDRLDRSYATAKQEKTLYPHAVVEFCVSLFRLASTVYKEHASARSCRVLGDFALIRLRGWGLRPFSDPAIGYLRAEPARYEEGEDFVLDEPRVFEWKEVLEEPDGCAFRLLRLLYEAFGYPEDRMPREFDRRTRRLVFRDS